MPVITQEKIAGFAHCMFKTCPGQGQVPVDAVRVEVGKTYGDAGAGDGGPLTGVVENSTVTFEFADEADRLCPHCKHPRQVSDQARTNYSPFDAPAEAEVARAVSAESRIAELEKKLSALAGETEGPG